MPLPRPREPTIDELRNRMDATNDGWFTIETVNPNWLAKVVIPSYLWSDWWGTTLKKSGLRWQDFQSVSKKARWTTEHWAQGDGEWNEVLERYSEELGMDIE